MSTPSHNRSEEARYDHRLHGLLLVSSGRSCNEVGALFGEAATTVQRWVRRFDESGFAGLREGERSGRPRSLDDQNSYARSAAQVAQRQSLQDAMQHGGFAGIGHEWWHFDHGDREQVRRTLPRIY